MPHEREWNAKLRENIIVGIIIWEAQQVQWTHPLGSAWSAVINASCFIDGLQSPKMTPK